MSFPHERSRNYGVPWGRPGPDGLGILKMDFDMKSALAAGLSADKTGHFPSRVPSGPNEGLILKSSTHPTFLKTVNADRALGFVMYEKAGRLYSFKDGAPNASFRKLSEGEIKKISGDKPVRADPSSPR